MGDVIEVNFERCGYCDGLFRPGQVSITGNDGKRYHAGPPLQCHHKHCAETNGSDDAA